MFRELIVMRRLAKDAVAACEHAARVFGLKPMNDPRLLDENEAVEFDAICRLTAVVGNAQGVRRHLQVVTSNEWDRLAAAANERR